MLCLPNQYQRGVLWILKRLIVAVVSYRKPMELKWAFSVSVLLSTLAGACDATSDVTVRQFRTHNGLPLCRASPPWAQCGEPIAQARQNCRDACVPGDVCSHNACLMRCETTKHTATVECGETVSGCTQHGFGCLATCSELAVTCYNGGWSCGWGEACSSGYFDCTEMCLGYP